MSFHFDEKTHSYAQNGIVIPSVTRILDHSGLVDFRMVREEILARKSELGTLVHIATHYYDLGDLEWQSLDDSIKGRTEAWAQFRADTGFVPRKIEYRFFATVNGMQYAGTVDREGLFKGMDAVIDLKTSASVEDWVGLQTAGYALGVPDGADSSPMALFHRRRRMAVQLFEDGRYKKFDYTDRNDATVFISGLHISWWKVNHGKALRPLDL